MSNPEDRLLSLRKFAADEKVRQSAPPQGWAPGFRWDGTRGQITTETLEAEPEDWGALLASRGLDPLKYEVVGDSIKWCSYDGWKRDEAGEDAYSTICYSYRADIRLRQQAASDLEALFLEARKLKRKPTTLTGDRALVILVSDWQVGNGDAGGIASQLEKIASLPQLCVERLRSLRRSGIQIGEIVLAGMGDLVEGCTGFYPAQQSMVQLDRREQTRVVRRGLLDLVKALAPLAPKVTVTAVAGNHGENRQNGKAITSPNDNDDVAVFEQVAEICAENPTVFGHLSWRLPSDRIAVSLEAGGLHIGFTHGHLAKPAGDPASTLWKWWTGQAMGREYEGIADAQILCSGHYHHLNVRSQQGRVLFIAPSLTAVGDWWANSTGMRTDPGTLTFVAGPDGWSNLEILR